MSNFVCPHCGLTNIDCGKDGYKTPKEIELEKVLIRIKEYCAKENTIQWFDFDNIEGIIDESLGVYDD